MAGCSAPFTSSNSLATPLEVRRRVQQDTTGHCGRTGDPLYQIRLLLRASHARLPDRRPGAQRGQGSIDFDGDTLECAAGVLGVASEPAPRVGAGTDDPGLVGGEDGALTFG